MLYFPSLWWGIYKMGGLNIHMRLDKADIEKTIILNRFDRVGDVEALEKIHDRKVFLTIKGTVKDLLRYDYLAFQNNSTVGLQENSVLISDVEITINMYENNSDYLYLEPSCYVDEHNTLQIYDLNFGVDQFNQIESTLNDQFTGIKATLYKELSKEEITESRKKEDTWFSFNGDYEELEYSTINKNIDGNDRKILCIKNNQNNIKLNHFRIYSSKPKYVKKEEWIDSVWSLEDKLEREQLDEEVILLDEIDKEINNFPKHILNELKKVNLLNYVLIILLIILVFKV